MDSVVTISSETERLDLLCPRSSTSQHMPGKLLNKTHLQTCAVRIEYNTMCNGKKKPEIFKYSIKYNGKFHKMGYDTHHV